MMATANLATKNAGAYPTSTIPQGTLVPRPLPPEAAAFSQCPADVLDDNIDQPAAGSSTQLCETQNISQFSFTNLPLYEETQLWDNIALLEDDNVLWQHESGTVSTTGGQVSLHAQHNQHQTQIFDGTIGNAQPMPTYSTWSQNLTAGPDSIIEELELGGFSTIHPLEPIYRSDLGPLYQAPDYEELFHTRDRFRNAELPCGFDPILSHSVIDPLACLTDRTSNSAEYLVEYGNETHRTAAKFQGSSNLPAAFSQTHLDDIGKLVSRERMAPRLLPHDIEGATSTTKRLSSDDYLQPFKCPRNHRSTASVHVVSTICQSASQTTEKFCQVAKRPNRDFDTPSSKSASLQNAMTPCINSDPDQLSQVFNHALAEILPLNSPEKQPQYSYPSYDTQTASVGGLQNFQIKIPQPVAPKRKSKAIRATAQSSENVCLQCKVRKKQCITTNGQSKSRSACTKCLDLANHDEILAKTLCIRPIDLDLKLVNPDVHFESCIAIDQKIPTLLSPTILRRVAIHMTYIVNEISHIPLLRASTALVCNVEEHKVNRSDDIAIDMLNYQIFYDLRYGKINHTHSRRMPSVGIPEGQVPKLPDLIKWATSSLALVPSGAVFGLQGPLYQFASLYIEQEDRPLRRLVELAVSYTSIYNVCIGQMSLQLSPASLVMYKVPPKMRVQICRPLVKYHAELSDQLQKSMLKALYGKHGPEKGEHLPLCIVWWLIMAVYRHNLDDSAAAASIYYGDEKMDENYLEDREKMLSNLSKTHQAIYHAIFRRDPKSFCPIFNDALVKLCRIENTDTELLEKLQSLRTAICQFKEDAAARRYLGKHQNKLEDLTDLFGAIDLEQHQSPPAHSKNETSVDTEIAEDVDDDVYSISSTCSSSSGISSQEREKSPAKIRTKTSEAIELRAYWLAKCMQVYDDQAWLFGY